MNPRRQHPAAAAARRARFYRGAQAEEQSSTGKASDAGVSSLPASGTDDASVRRAGPSGWVDGGRFPKVEDAA